METVAVLLARALAWVESFDLNPTGAVFGPDLVKAIVDRYKFQKFPQKIEEFDETKGVTFSQGKFGDTVIEQLVIYTYGIVLDTRKSTQESRRVLEEAFQWGGKTLGLAYKPSMVRGWQYESQVTFYSSGQFLSVHSALQALAERVTKGVGEITGENLNYELTNLTLNHDLLKRKHPLGLFTIQRRDNTPFSQNKYFSSAPLPTDMHIKILEQFEADLNKAGK
jgi:hypothetical protein